MRRALVRRLGDQSGSQIYTINLMVATGLGVGVFLLGYADGDRFTYGPWAVLLVYLAAVPFCYMGIFYLGVRRGWWEEMRSGNSANPELAPGFYMVSLLLLPLIFLKVGSPLGLLAGPLVALSGLFLLRRVGRASADRDGPSGSS